MEGTESTHNTKISDSAYSNSCSNSQSQRSGSSSKSRQSNSSGSSSGYGGKQQTADRFVIFYYEIKFSLPEISSFYANLSNNLASNFQFRLFFFFLLT